MPRRKTFRKRRQKRIQKGGAARTISNINGNKELPAFTDDPVKYYGMVRKTRKNTSSVAGGGNSSEYDFESFIVNKEQKDAICANPEDKVKIMTNAADNFTNFYEDPMDDTKTELITFFEFTDPNATTLQTLKIDSVDNINWTTYVGCNP